MKVGDLLKHTHYGLTDTTVHYGLLLRVEETTKEWGDIWVLTAEGERLWISWQCEVINESR